MNKYLFPHITRFLLLLIPLTFFGFNPTYFSKLSKVDFVYHVHAILMLIWVAVAIIQPILIKKKNPTLHRTIGRTSYIIMPVLFITSYMVIRHTYYNFIFTQTAEMRSNLININQEEIISAAAAYIMIGVVYIIWLMIFYVLAIFNRKKIVYHSTYMFAAILTLLGPTIDRILYQITTYFDGSYNAYLENGVFCLNLIILSSLIIYQKRSDTNIKPAVTSLIIYAIGIAGYHYIPKHPQWGKIVDAIM